MKIVDLNKTPLKAPVGDLPLGSTVIDGEGNLYLICRGDQVGKTRLVNLRDGGTYLVNNTCEHEPVEATISWKRNG